MGEKEGRGVGVYVDAGRERDRGLECPIEDRDHRMVACHVYARDLREEEEPVGADVLGPHGRERGKAGSRGLLLGRGGSRACGRKGERLVGWPN